AHLREMREDRGLVKSVQCEGKMVKIAALGARGRAPHHTELAADGDKIDERGACAELVEADLSLFAFLAAAEDILVEAAHPLEIDNPKHDMVEAAQLKGRRRHAKTPRIILSRYPARRGPSNRRGKDR